MKIVEKVGQIHQKVNDWYLRDSNSVVVGSLTEFTNLINESGNSVVKLFPQSVRTGYWFRRDLRPEERHGGFEPNWTSDFDQTGWKFETVWQMSNDGKNIRFFEVHQQLDLRRYDLYPTEYYQLKDKWFDNALKEASEQYKQHSEVRFLVSGISGLLPYHYYLNRRHYGHYREEFTDQKLFPWTKGMRG